MSRRDRVRAAEAVWMFRRLQEETALTELDRRRLAARRAAQAQADAEDALRDAETAWRAVLDGRSMDAASIALWRAEAEKRGRRLRDEAESATEARRLEMEGRAAWARSLHVAELADAAARTARRDLARHEEEARLAAVEDLFRARRRRLG